MTLLNEFDDWQSERKELSAQEASGKFPHADDWHGSDDAGCALAQRLAEVLRPFADIDQECWYMQATAFTCTEAEAIYKLIEAVHGTDAADVFLDSHAIGDEEGDMHHKARMEA